MKFTYNWLKEFFAELKISPQALADKLTMAGLEVKSIESAGSDSVFEVEITSNRPDWLSVIGIAREVAALTGKKIKSSKEAVIKKKIDPAHRGFRIAIEDKKDCPLYHAAIVANVKIAPSPQWLKEKLELIGCRSINNVVDITNYCMYTWGQPLHVFDLDKLAPGMIGVRRAKPGETLSTIDGQERVLDKEVLVITDRDKAVALAGVMGGKDTEASDTTTTILLEAAIFDPLVVRRGRRKLGIQSDASYRFERTVDIYGTEKVANQALRLIQKVAGGQCVLMENSNRILIREKTVIFDMARARNVLGIDTISMSQAKKYLHGLGFLTKQKTNTMLTIKVPSFRPDVTHEVDIIEEIARVHGYKNVPTTLAAVIPQRTDTDQRAAVPSVKQVLVGLGLQEVITYSLVARELLKGFEEFGAGVEVLNPLSKEQEILRPTLLASLLKCVATNLNQKQEYIAVFEIADAFIHSVNSHSPVEETRLAVALCGETPVWLVDGHVKDKAGFLHLKGIVETVFAGLGIAPSSYSFHLSKAGGQFDIYVDTQKVGGLFRLPRSLLEARDIKNKDVFALEIALTKVLSAPKHLKHYTPLPKFPYIQRDISLALKEETKLADILALIAQGSKGLLQKAEAIDCYKGEHLERGYKGLTVSCRYASPGRTLTEAEINPVHDAVVRALVDTLGAKVR